MTEEELKNKCKERAKIFQQAMESCHSNNPIDCIEWFADRIIEFEAENEQIKNSDTLCKLIGEQKRKISDLEAQIEKMKIKWHDLEKDQRICRKIVKQCVYVLVILALSMSLCHKYVLVIVTV